MIELMSVEDLDQVLEMETKAFNNPWNRKYFIHEMNDNDLSLIYVEKEDDEVIAYGDIWILFENCDPYRQLQGGKQEEPRRNHQLQDQNQGDRGFGEEIRRSTEQRSQQPRI